MSRARRGDHAAAAAAHTGSAADAPVRVLIVDDDSALRRLLRATLGEGFEIAEASGARSAIERAEASPPALVLLDWQMPGGTGAQVLEVLGPRRDVSLVVITGERDAQSRELARSLGADAFLTKPFSPLELLRTIDRLLDEAAAEAAAGDRLPSQGA